MTIQSSAAKTILQKYACKYGILEDVWTNEDVKQKLFDNTDDVIQKGGFGVPFVTVDNKNWWGQDRLHLLESYLQNPQHQTCTEDYWPDLQKNHPISGQEIHFYHDFASPFSYLGSTQIEGIAERYGLKIIYKPILLGALFRKIGTPNVPIFTMSKAKQRYMMQDLQDWANWWNVPFSFPKKFPMRTVTPLRAALVEPRITSVLYNSYWVQGRDIANKDELIKILDEQGFDGTSIVEACSHQNIKDQLIENGKEAEHFGICGVPSMRFKNEVWWGQDRLKSMILSLT